MDQGVTNRGKTDADSGSDPGQSRPGDPPRHTRRLFDKIMLSFHHAVDLSDLDIAQKLLAILEEMTTRKARPEDGERRRGIENLVAAHERLWYLRHRRID